MPTINLLFDQNISFRLVNKISDIFPDSKQVRVLGLENAKDTEIFDYAKKNNFAIVTFDADFCDLSIVKGFPPKIIWLRMGNATTDELEIIFRKKCELIELFLEEDYACLELID